MSRNIVRALCVLAVLGLAPSASSAPDDRVPRVTNDMLPVVGTCAPIERENVTHVMLGRVGWYLVKGVAEPLDSDGLVAFLETRVGAERPSPHSVWLQASKDHVWGHVVKARLACSLAGIYRVGVRVIHEQDKRRVYGFPMFLPAAAEPEGPKVGTASRLPIVVDRTGYDTDVEHEGSSDPRVLWAAATRAREKYDQDVVAEVRIHNNVNLQYALTVLDMLYRAGCAAVRIPTLTLVSRVQETEHVQIRIVRTPRYHKDAVLPPKPIAPILVPDVAPRTRPWPLHGANRPGALYLELEELPLPGEDRPAKAYDPLKPLPNYLRRGQVGASIRAEVTKRIADWARGLGPVIRDGLRSSADIEKSMVVRLRPPEKLSPVVASVARAFPRADDVRFSSVRFDVLLFDEGQPVGVLDATLHVDGDLVTFVFARPGRGDLPVARNLPPEPVDRFAAGVPGAFRVWLEAFLLDLQKRPGATVPLTPLARVLADLPAAARSRMRDTQSLRESEAAATLAYVRGLSFERLILKVREASATVRSQGEIVGIVQFGLEAEEKELRINALEPHPSR